ncbi:MAG TPA: hypothetical protein VNT51_03425 [Miltoncostaeaceae bacterium]|nr:hypothetical protein [Miltoncostaeaceae bacterium]
MTPVQRCEDCGRLFPYLPRTVCAPCLEVREERFRRVRDWYRANPGGSVADAAATTEVTVAEIGAWMAEGRLLRVSVGDDLAAPFRADEERRAAIRRALATTDAPASAAAPPAAPDRRRGLYGREH